MVDLAANLVTVLYPNTGIGKVKEKTHHGDTEGTEKEGKANRSRKHAKGAKERKKGRGELATNNHEVTTNFQKDRWRSDAPTDGGGHSCLVQITHDLPGPGIGDRQ